MSIYKDNLRPLELDKVKTYPLASRPSKVSLDNFAKPIAEDSSLKDFLASLPNILAVQSLRSLAARMHRARELQKPIIWGIGGHVIKTGLAPIIIDLMRRGFVTAIHAPHQFGEQTKIRVRRRAQRCPVGKLLNRAAQEGARDQIGLGEAMGRALVGQTPKHADHSLLCAAYDSKVPFTAHVTIGGDIAHFHPEADGASLGAATHTDFRLLAELVRRMNGGGVDLNIGSAVVLPEVFLKCVTLVRNLGHELNDITTANFDFIQSYRPLTNVVRRPTADGSGQGYSITGHHELTIPLLAAELICGHHAQ